MTPAKDAGKLSLWGDEVRLNLRQVATLIIAVLVGTFTPCVGRIASLAPTTASLPT
jgi:hypothetical protein